MSAESPTTTASIQQVITDAGDTATELDIPGNLLDAAVSYQFELTIQNVNGVSSPTASIIFNTLNSPNFVLSLSQSSNL